MKTPSQDAIVAFHNWNNAFNNRDAKEQIKYMYFPHLRLANDKYQLWDTPDDFRKLQESMTENLMKENWHHTTTLSIEDIQSGEDKVHLAILQSRRDINDIEYNQFQTFWIFTKEQKNWKARFRSSFLTNTNANGTGSKNPFNPYQ